MRSESVARYFNPDFACDLRAQAYESAFSERKLRKGIRIPDFCESNMTLLDRTSAYYETCALRSHAIACALKYHITCQAIRFDEPCSANPAAGVFSAMGIQPGVGVH